MKKLVIVFSLLLLTLPDDSIAGWRWRARRCRQHTTCDSYVTWSHRSDVARDQAPIQAPATPLDVFVSPNGKRYRFYDSPEVPLHSDTPAPQSFLDRYWELPLPAAGADDYFEGEDRAAAKTSIADAEVEEFSGLAELLATLPSDSSMRNHDPPITDDPDSERVEEEERNVAVEAYLYAARREGDNDYHLVLGHGPSERSRRRLICAEVTGLPRRRGEDVRKLRRAREDFKAYFQNGRPPGHTYRVFADPIPVRIEGSLFYDIDHAPGIVGTGRFKPITSWEIHPISAIEFLEE